MTTRWLPTALASGSHGCVDVYQGMVPVLVPFLVLERDYDYSAVSGFVLAATVLSALAQPLFGVLADRWPADWLVPTGLAVAGTGVALVGPVDSYVGSLSVIALAGLGVAAYHPEAARAVRERSDGRPAAMSWFSLGGNLGFALAPAIAVPVLVSGGLAATPYLAAPAVVGVALSLPLRRRASVPGGTPAAERSQSDWPAFRRLAAVTVLRSVVYVGLATFVGLYVAARDGGSAGGALFALFAGGCVGTLLGGRLAGRWGLVRTIRRAYAVSTIALAAITIVPGPAVYGVVFLTAACLYVPFSLHITLGQAYLPSRTALASGVTLGLAVSAGGVFAPVLGAVADAASLRVALVCLIVPAVAAGVLARGLADPRPERMRARAGLG